jgi:hypothetical protein
MNLSAVKLQASGSTSTSRCSTTTCRLRYYHKKSNPPNPTDEDIATNTQNFIISESSVMNFIGSQYAEIDSSLSFIDKVSFM